MQKARNDIETAQQEFNLAKDNRQNARLAQGREITAHESTRRRLQATSDRLGDATESLRRSEDEGRKLQKRNRELVHELSTATKKLRLETATRRNVERELKKERKALEC